MKYLTYKITVSLVFCLLGGAGVLAQKQNNKIPKGKYENITVAKFDIKEGIKFPESSIDVLMAEIVDELKKYKQFKQVSLENQNINKEEESENVEGEKINPEDSSETFANSENEPNQKSKPRVRLSGTIIKYKPGSRAARYLSGVFGSTKLVAQIKFVDIATDNILYEKKVTGKVYAGVWGGDSKAVTRELARAVGQRTIRKFFKGH